MRLPSKLKILKRMFATTNPRYPEARNGRYGSKTICDATWGREWTIAVYEVTASETKKAKKP